MKIPAGPGKIPGTIFPDSGNLFLQKPVPYFFTGNPVPGKIKKKIRLLVRLPVM